MQTLKKPRWGGRPRGFHLDCARAQRMKSLLKRAGCRSALEPGCVYPNKGPRRDANASAARAPRPVDGRIDAASESKAGLHALPSGEEKTVGKLRFAWAVRRKTVLSAQAAYQGGENPAKIRKQKRPRTYPDRQPPTKMPPRSASSEAFIDNPQKSVYIPRPARSAAICPCNSRAAVAAASAKSRPDEA